MEKVIRKQTQPVLPPRVSTKGKKSDSQATSHNKRNFGFAKSFIFVSDDLFTDDLKP